MRKWIAVFLLACSTAFASYNYLVAPSDGSFTLGAGGYYYWQSSAVTPTSDLILQYLFGDSGDTANITLDTSGNSYTGTVTGVNWREATNGLANHYYFDNGAGDNISAGDESAFTFGNGTTDSPFTLSFMMLGLTSFSATDGWLSKATSSTAGEYYFITTSGGNAFFRLVDNSTGAYIGKTISSAFTADRWYNVHLTYDGSGNESGIKIYFDGQAKTTSSSSSGSYTAMEDTSAALLVGDRASEPAFGRMTLVEIITNELTAAEILATNRYQSVQLGLTPQWFADNPEDDTNCVWAVTFNNNILTDGSRSHRAMTAASAPTSAGSPSNGWYNFSSPNEVRGGTADILLTNQQFTIATWFNTDSISGFHELMELQSDTSQSFLLGISDNGSYGDVFFGSQSAATTGWGRHDTGIDGNISTGAWHCVIITYDGNGTADNMANTNFTCTIDSISETVETSASFNAGGANNIIGSGNGSYYWDGDVDETFIIVGDAWSLEKQTNYYNTSKAYLGH
jgi:hypothetical protein